MSGPLTPPPTSAIEIRDATRSSVPPADVPVDVDTNTAEPIVTDPPSQEAESAVPAQAQAQAQFTAYQFLFPSLAELVAKGDYKELVRLAERSDLNAEDDGDISRLLVTAPLVLSYLILDNLPPARFALIRLPTSLAKLPLSRALFSLLAAVWDKHYDKVYARAGDLLAATQQPPVPDFDLGTLVAKLVDTFVETFRRKTFILLSKAYSSIPLALARSYLGLQPEQLLAVASEHGWSYNERTQVLAPVRQDGASPLSKAIGSGSSLSTFNAVADGLILDTN